MGRSHRARAEYGARRRRLQQTIAVVGYIEWNAGIGLDSDGIGWEPVWHVEL
jgi:hypothetical protein